MENEIIYDYVGIEEEEINPKISSIVEKIVNENLEGKTLVLYAVNTLIPSFIIDYAKRKKGIFYNVVDFRKIHPKDYYESFKTHWDFVERQTFDNYVLTSVRTIDDYDYNTITVNSPKDDYLINVGYKKDKENQVREKEVYKKLINKRILSRF